jgi:hypothetical protein
MGNLDPQMKLLIAEASREGARRALEEIGIRDEDDIESIREVRGLIEAWRQVKKGFLQQLGRMLAIAILAAIASFLVAKGWWK